MEEWKEYKLGEVAVFSQGIQVGIEKQIETCKEGYVRFIRIVDYTKGTDAPRYILYPGARYMVDETDIVMMRYGTPGKVARGYSGAIANNMFKISVNEDFLNKDYTFYYLSQDSVYRTLVASNSSSTMPAINFKIIEGLDISAPSISEQMRIVKVLKSLDDKIEVNRKINENLEQQAQALFKSWFVDFEPFKNGEFVESELGMIPKGWRVGTIGEYCKVRSGFAFKSTWWTNEGVPVIKIKNITDNGKLEMLDCSFVSKEHAALAKEFQTIEGDLLIAMTGATIGKFCIVHDNSKYCVNQRVGKFFLGNEPLKKLPFIFLNLKQSSVHDEIINRGQGSAQPNISGGDIETLKVVIAPDVVISNFNVMLYPSFKKMISNQQESCRLAELRNTLLPKLMSGELKVNAIVA